MSASSPGSTVSSLSFEHRSGNLYQFSKKREASLIHIVEQEVIDRLLAKKVEAREAAKEADEMEQYVVIALRSGAQIEPGLHTAELITVHRKAHRVRSGSFTRLVIR